MNKRKLFDACEDITLDIFHGLECGDSIPLYSIYELYRHDDGHMVVRNEFADILEVNLQGETIRFTDIYGIS